MDQATRLPDGTFRPGYSGNPRGPRLVKERREAIERSLLAELGDVELTALDRELLARAIDNLVQRPRNNVAKAALLNSARRVIREIRDRHTVAKRQPTDPWQVQLLDPGEERAGAVGRTAKPTAERASEADREHGEPFDEERLP
jgi:hypothetical protein